MIKIALADDEILLRNAIADIIDSNQNMRVIMRAKNGREILDMLEICVEQPDILLLDINMPELDGLSTANIVLEKFPEIKIIILTMYDTELLLLKLLQSGIRGFMKKDILSEELMLAIETVFKHGYYYNQYATIKLINSLRKKGIADHEFAKRGAANLNDTELIFLKHSCGEMTYKEIASKMNISPRTIDNYRDSLFDKLDVKSRVGLAIYAFRNGLIHI